jgi:hypothetical protein
MARAFALTKKLLGGEIRLDPQEKGYLEAEMAGDLGGLFELAADKINVVPRKGLEPSRGCPH